MTVGKIQDSGFILIVEDDPGIGELEAQRLKPLGLMTRLAASAEETIGILKASAPALMLLDYSLPGANALELLKRLRESAIAIPPFLIVTGRGDEAVAVETMKSGASDYIIKNSDFLENLLPAAGKALEKAALLAELEAAQKSTAKNLRLYNFLAQVNQAAAQTKDRPRLFRQLCDIAVNAGSMRMAWIGMPDKDLGRITPFCRAGAVGTYLDSIKITLDYECPASRGPGGSAVSSGEICACADIATDPVMAPWREKALEMGYHSVAAIPLAENGRVVAVLAIYSGEPFFFSGDELKLLNEIKGNISLALDAISAEEKRAASQAALARTAVQLTHALEATPVILFTLRRTAQGDIPEWVSGSAEVLTGFSPSEMLMPGWWANNLHPQDKAAVITGQNDIFHKGALTQDYRLRKKNGQYLWIRSQLKTISSETGEISGSWTDITRIKESEESFKNLLDSLPYGYIVRRGFKVVYINAVGLKTLGVKDKEGLPGRDVLTLLPEAQRAAFRRSIEETDSRGVSVQSLAMRLPGPAGSIADLEISGVPIVFGGEKCGLLSFRDVVKK